VVPKGVLDNSDGDSYVTNSYGYPYEAKNVQTGDYIDGGTFNLGDVQSHRYLGFHNFVPEKVPFIEHKESVPAILTSRYDGAQNRIKTSLEAENDGELGAAATAAAKAAIPWAGVPESITHDWTG
jgi:hypothetical protein